ncbi:MAG: hypothetical protein CVV48_11340 [Spirochaetae bacterium HGW-Spirochaetae-4]|jgi:hypothetical protein|nr:MAG: hypothetical protein CVV48_11340 [Spirochaetae bacterium HGW-Spirochaetae-4]
MDDFINLGDTEFWQFNACVGTNGVVNERLYYIGFAEATKKLCLVVIEQDRYLADSLIYPIVFCLRHSIELAIKTVIIMLFELNQHMDEKKVNLIDHNIISLFEKLKEYSKFDEEIYVRVEGVEENIPDSIRAIIEIDTRGETFRYRKDNKKNNHLDGQVRHINIKNLYEEYLKLERKISELFNLIEYKMELDSYLDDNY